MKRFLLMIKYRQYRWAARLTGLLGMVFFISYFTATGFLEFDIQGEELTFVIILFSMCLIAYILSWFIEIIGGLLLTISAVLLPFYVQLNEGISASKSLIYYGLPFLIPGILFIIAWWIKVMRKTAPEQ
ncbi:MAG: hypothetical protein IH598_03650 [Bacteroidales bacterium]|nr:hypothetical protein [Bacteroidales bacterium]